MNRHAIDGPELSLILPVHNGEAFILESAETVLAVLAEHEIDVELLIVVDGGHDATAARARTLKDPRVRVFDYQPNQGKGAAIAYGFQAATGRFVGWLDADLDLAPLVMVGAVRLLRESNVDFVVGSKRHPASLVQYPPVRRLYSWGFQMLVRLLFHVNTRDTQVGAKVARREVLDIVAPLLLVKRFAFDLEILAVAAEFGFDRVEEAPVELRYRFSGSGVNWKAVIHMFQDTLAIAYRIHVRRYYVRRFAALQRTRTSSEEDVR